VEVIHPCGLSKIVWHGGFGRFLGFWHEEVMQRTCTWLLFKRGTSAGKREIS